MNIEKTDGLVIIVDPENGGKPRKPLENPKDLEKLIGDIIKWLMKNAEKK
jgi:hypothetical protein